MKHLIATVILAISCISCFAQLADKVMARVRYTYINKNDSTLQKRKVPSENMLLFIGKNASLFTSYDKVNYEIAEDQKSRAKAMARVKGNGAPTMVMIDRSAGDWMTKTNYFVFQKEKKMIVKEILLENYIMEYPLVEINWKISKDTTTFAGIFCQKATASYEGKNWTAWFAPSLPFQSGPYLLHGLPGLIIEAYDDKENIQYKFAGFEMAKEEDFIREDDIKKRPTYQPGQISTVDVSLGLDVAGAYFDNTIQIPTYATIKTTKKEFDKLKAAYQKDPKGFMRAQLGF